MKQDITLGIIMNLVVFGFFGTVGYTVVTDKNPCWLPEGCKAKVTQPVYQDNPYTYKMGSVVSVAYVDGGLVVRLQPTATYGLFTEDILLCGKPVDMFTGKRNPMVITYETRAHTTVQSIGCHELKRVDETK